MTPRTNEKLTEMLLRTAVVVTALFFLSSPVLIKGTKVLPEIFDVCATCHPNATCDEKTDGSGGFTCNCMYGFVGNGRTYCEDKDECQTSSYNICGRHTACHNTYGSFYCTCLSGYSPSNNMAIFIPNDGTYCHDIDECKVQGICGEGGRCRNKPGFFECECQIGYQVQNGSVPFHPRRDQAFCKVECGPPPSAEHAVQISPTRNRYGSMINYRCKEGFLWRGGDNMSFCGLQGMWKGPSLICEEVDCGEPPVFPYSIRRWTKNRKMGSKVFYDCDVGFHNTGTESISVCTANGKWKHPNVLCQEMVCGEPPAIPHTLMLWDKSTSIGNKVFYECDTQHYYVGDGNISICTTSGVWSEATVTCQEIVCRDPPLLPHAGQVWNGSSTVGSTVLYFCAEGFYYVNGSRVSVCTGHGNWSRSTLVCQEIDCGDPPVWPHSHMRWNQSSKMNALVFYECDAGFYNAGRGNVSVCTAEGVWNQSNILCREITCGKPPTFPHSHVLWNKHSNIGMEVFYQCEVGYYNVGDGNSSVCSVSGEWKKPSVMCQEISCGWPPVMPHAVMQWDSRAGLGSVVQYACKDGFYQDGGKGYAVCTLGRKWKTNSVSCKAKCGAVPEVPYSEIVWQNDSMALHRCMNGYYNPGGNNRSVCGHNGQWNTTMHCKELDYGINDIHVFNEKCLRWKAGTNSGKKEDYKMVFIGVRDYQKIFRDERRRYFSSSAARPEVCLDLLPATNYTVNITTMSALTSTITTINTSIPAPPVPEVTYRDVESPLPTLWLRRSTCSLDPICLYEVFVMPVEGTLVFDCNSPRTPHFFNQGSCHGEYIAAQIQLKDVGKEMNFTIGDQQYYGQFYNAPLENGKDYSIVLRTVCQWGQISKRSCVIWAKARGLYPEESCAYWTHCPAAGSVCPGSSSQPPNAISRLHHVCNEFCVQSPSTVLSLT
ncbi:sushi domain-containing protein 1 isoform X2 [Denticeps clupeoides]|uniref:sushi domain-containing protein 1 isoform X2 n=1 Tax=Denticeps clupeoides TaxID=299321 RepID=UPI0010A399D8|nr:sushi domain-containing protein 1-like isoform X2 [Denticeps clupeoides]